MGSTKAEVIRKILAQVEAAKGSNALQKLREIAQPDTVTPLKDINNGK